METSLTLFIISSLLLGVNSYCDWTECVTEVDQFLASSTFCDSIETQRNAILALKKCALNDEKKEPCPENVRTNTPLKAYEIQDKMNQCGLREQRATCEGAEYFLCFAGLGEFAFSDRFVTVTDIASACELMDPLLDTLDICKSCVGSFFGSAWDAVKAEVEATWASATTLLQGGCDCAARIQDTINTVDRNSTCRFIQFVSAAAEDIAQKCVVDLVESFQTFDWLTITKNYIETIHIYTGSACFFAGQESSSTSTAVNTGLLTVTTALAIFARFSNLAA